MGTIVQDTIGLGDVLFSRTQRQILGLLFGNPDKSFYLKEIVRLAEVGTGSVMRELDKLSTVGLLTVERVGNQKHYQANRQSPIYEELKGIVGKTFGLADALRDALDDFKAKVALAFIYGSVAKGADRAGSDIDIMIVTDQLSYSEIFEVFSGVEEKLVRSLNPTIYSSSEFQNKVATDNSFVTRVLEQEKIFLIGGDDDIAAISKFGQSRTVEDGAG